MCLYITDDEVELIKQEGLSRTLSLAIIPGHHISSISVAKGKSCNAVKDPSLKHHDQHENQQKKSQRDQQDHNSQHEDQYEDHHDQNKDPCSKGHESENTVDTCTEEDGQTREDIDTPQKHLTLQ